MNTATPIDYKALLLTVLSLPPEATDEQIAAKEAEMSAAAHQDYISGGKKDKWAGSPPAPQHEPGAGADEPTQEAKIAQSNTLIAKIRKEGKFKDYTSAREEARRQRPELFA
jgi:hypothetical protein